jgi:hypothetical protein
MRRIFAIDYPDENGPMWMNVDNLQLIIDSYCKDNKNHGIIVTDITDEFVSYTYVVDAGPDEGG